MLNFLHKRLVASAAAVVVSVSLAACGSSDSDSSATGTQPTQQSTPVPTPDPSNSSAQQTPPAQTNTIVDVAISNPEFSILVEAVVAAGLVDVLKSDGPLTVFAPTNAAFLALLAELGVSKEELLANPDLLKAVLTYHVLAGKVEAADVAAVLGKPILTVAGGIFKIESGDGGLAIIDERNRSSKIIATDIQADNGVIHVIDRVLLPGDKNIVETAIAASEAHPPQFTILVQALLAADPLILQNLAGPGPYTVFAPTDEAFLALLHELHLSAEQLLANQELLDLVLTYHVVPGRILKAHVPVGQPIQTANGQTFEVNAKLEIIDQRHRVSRIIATDILATNGVIHVIDRVLRPH
jgi:uncharacterized surface protein with fasciclin (FAS1) repeats